MESPSSATASNTTGSKIVLDDQGSILYYFPTFLPAAEAMHYYQSLLASIPWKNQDDSWEHQPRKVAWFSDKGETLVYSKVHLSSNVWLAPLLELKEKIVQLPEVAPYHAHTKIDSCLANLYENGDNFLGFHSDTAKMWGPHPLIASLTLGSARKFVMVRKSAVKQHGAANAVTDTKDRYEFNLPSGSLLLMTGESQLLWLHGVPRQPEITTPRINLTFRNFLGSS